MPRPAPPEVAYVLKGWPRISELFIASEIYRLEQAGLLEAEIGRAHV